jgi:polar amino acid transport system substrate-binding protein
MTRYTRRAAFVAALTALAAALGGCGAISDQALRTSLHALAVRVSSTTATTTSGAPPRCDPTASLKPSSPPAAPGHMPAGSFMRAIQRRGYLIAGVNESYLLFSFFDPSSGKIEGFEIDLLHQIAKAIFGTWHNKIEFEEVTVPQRLPFVQQGKVDIVADAVTMTCARWRNVDFSSTYYDGGVRVMVPASSNARQLSDLAHQRVCATTGSVPLEMIARSPYKLIPYGVPQGIYCLVALEQGKVAGIVSDDSLLIGSAMQVHNVKILPFSVADAPYGMAISKNHPGFVRFVNAVLERTRRDGTWASIYHRWLGPYSSGPTPPPPKPHYS